MDDAPGAATPSRRRRSDAQRSAQAIVSAARTLLVDCPDSSMDQIASAAGVTRQTVYAHFPSRAALVQAIVEAAGAEFEAALDAADLDSRHPSEAVTTFLDIGWPFLRRYFPLLLVSEDAHDRVVGDGPHHAVAARLERIIRRGQRIGEFDRALSATWLATAILGLGHTAGQHVTSGHLTPAKAVITLRVSALRLCGVR